MIVSKRIKNKENKNYNFGGVDWIFDWISKLKHPDVFPGGQVGGSGVLPQRLQSHICIKIGPRNSLEFEVKKSKWNFWRLWIKNESVQDVKKELEVLQN